MKDNKTTPPQGADTGTCEKYIVDGHKKRSLTGKSSFGSLFWAMAFILLGLLLLARGQGWIPEDSWLPYFLVGLGTICLANVMAHCFHPSYRYFSYGRTMAGILLIFVGTALLLGFSLWLPISLLFIGLTIAAGFFIKEAGRTTHR